MKTLAPVFVVLILLLAMVSAVSAQGRIHNPELPQHLVFQWRIKTDQVDVTWSNADFSVMRDDEGLVVFYGRYRTLEEALAGLPQLPESVRNSDVTLIPFFNQRSISARDALTLLGNLNYLEMQGTYELEEAVSFSVYFATYETAQGRRMLDGIEGELSFEVLPNYNYAYSAGLFNTLADAEHYATVLRKQGFSEAAVNKYLNGQKVAMRDEKLLYAYVNWMQ